MPEDKIRVSARISKELYDICLQRYDNITNAINAGLELLRAHSEDEMKTNEDERQTDEDIRRQNEDSNSRGDIQELRARLEEKDTRIEDLKNHIYLLDNQLRTKDDQIEKLNENMHKTAVHIQSLIQENSRLNTKLLPEKVEKKKPFWKFW
jgi:uncharacterized protein involved in exopolysaccharide biosynthesis